MNIRIKQVLEELLERLLRMAKKITLVIVEGPSDAFSFENILNLMAKKDNEIEFEIANEDITSSNYISPTNVRSKITELIKKGGRKYKPSDYKEIIHIIDLDGIYLDNDRINQAEVDKFLYYRDKIEADSREKVIKRNEKKRKIVDTLLQTTKVYNIIPYRVFYFSCNLEDVLHNIINVDSNDKITYANEFEDKYYDNLVEFTNFMCNSDFSSRESYLDSWKEIKKITDCIPSKTNFNLYIEELNT